MSQPAIFSKLAAKLVDADLARYKTISSVQRFLKYLEMISVLEEQIQTMDTVLKTLFLKEISYLKEGKEEKKEGPSVVKTIPNKVAIASQLLKNNRHSMELIVDCTDLHLAGKCLVKESVRSLIFKLWKLYLLDTSESNQAMKWLFCNAGEKWVYTCVLEGEKQDSPLAMPRPLFEIFSNHDYQTEKINFSSAVKFVTSLIFSLGSPYALTAALLEEQNCEFKRNHTFWEKKAANCVDDINADILWMRTITDESKYRHFFSTIPKGNFDVINERTSRRILSAMSLAIKETKGAEEWFLADGRIDSKSPMLRTLSTHSAVEACGHSGNSMAYVLSNFRTIIQKGWSYWAQAVVTYRGLGWDFIKLEEAIDFGNEKCIIHLLEKLAPSRWTPEFTSNIFTHCVTKELKKILKFLLRGNYLPLEAIWKTAFSLKNGRIEEALRLHLGERELTHMPAKGINFTRAVLTLWKLVPPVELVGREPTEEDVINSTSKYNGSLGYGLWFGKDMNHFGIDKKGRLWTYGFDKVFGVLGHTKQILEERCLSTDVLVVNL